MCSPWVNEFHYYSVNVDQDRGAQTGLLSVSHPLSPTPPHDPRVDDPSGRDTQPVSVPPFLWVVGASVSTSGPVWTVGVSDLRPGRFTSLGHSMSQPQGPDSRWYWSTGANLSLKAYSANGREETKDRRVIPGHPVDRGPIFSLLSSPYDHCP